MHLDGWTRVRLGDFVTLQRGHDLPDEQRRPGTVPILGSFGVTGWHDEARASGPGVTVGRSGASFGVATYSSTDFWPLNTALYVVDFHENDERFAYYFLKQFDFAGYNSGSAQPSLNRNLVHPIHIDIPPVSEQRAITRILSALDDKIELNRRMNETLEAIARALFKSWFVDFDPVRAKAEGRDPGLPKVIANLFPDRLVDSELGEIPQGWQIHPLDDTSVYMSRGISPTYIEYDGVLVLNQKCVRGGRVDVSKGRRHDPRARPIEDRLLERGDILVNSTGVGTLGRVGQLMNLEEHTIVDSHVTIVRADEKLVSWNYLGIFLRGREQEIEALGEGSTGQTELSRPRFALLPVLIPPRPLIAAFDKASVPLRERTSVNESASRTLAAIRDALLPKLISGELRVKDAEHVVDEAAA